MERTTKRAIFILVAYLLLSTACSRPSSVQNDNTQSRPKTEDEVKFGLTKTTRMAIFREVYNLHSAARPLVEKKYPIRDRNLVYHNYELYRALLKKRKMLEDAIIADPKKKLAAKYGTTVEVLESIYEEGILSFWNLPELKPRDIDPGWHIPDNPPI